MRNDVGYHPIAKLLHWSTVPLIIAQFGFAFAISDGGQQRLPDRPALLHISTGILILGVTLLRLAWRVHSPPDAAISRAADWQEHCARAVHRLIYALLVFLPLSGIFSAYLRGWGVSFFGMPLLAATMRRTHAAAAQLVATAHASAAIVLLSVLGLHLLAVGYHMFVRADGVVERMMPESLNRRMKPAGSQRS